MYLKTVIRIIIMNINIDFLILISSYIYAQNAMDHLSFLKSEKDIGFKLLLFDLIIFLKREMLKNLFRRSSLISAYYGIFFESSLYKIFILNVFLSIVI